MLSNYIYEYVWLDSQSKFRSKTRVLEGKQPQPQPWNYDGSSTGQATGTDSDINLVPRAVYRNPMMSHPNAYLVICDTYDSKDRPLANNHRQKAAKLFESTTEHRPWYGLEQEYFLIDQKTGRPAGFPASGEPKEGQGPYYCSGVRNVGRQVVDEHLLACLHAGLKISGANAEVALGQWEFQIGPVEGIEVGDQLLAARFMLEHIANKHGFDIDYRVKPLKGDWNGSGCHVNFSTKLMREGSETVTGSETVAKSKGNTGLDYIYAAIANLEKRHSEHLPLYGDGNSERLSGAHETSHYSVFSCGEANRGASIRIGSETIKNKCGYFEDRRPGSNIDPYLVCAKMLASVLDLDY